MMEGLAKFVVWLLFGAVFCGYFRMIEIVLFVVLVIGFVHLDLVDSRTMLLGRGRKERFWGAIASGAALTLLTTLWVCGAIAASAALKPIMPELNLRGMPFSYGAIRWTNLYVTMAVMPALLAIDTVLRSRTVLKAAIGMAIMQVSVLTILLMRAPGGDTMRLGAGWKVLLVAVSWWGSWYILRRHCMRGQLVGPKD